jgi:hypothetical protein
VPVVIYGPSARDEARLQRYARSLVIKGVFSPERLLDETALFLHRDVSRLRGDQQPPWPASTPRPTCWPSARC